MAPRKKTTKSATATATHPTYATMIHESLENNKPHMTSLVLLKNMIEQNYEVTPKKHALLSALAKGVESGDVVKVKGSYRLKGKGNSGTSSGRTRSASTTVSFCNVMVGACLLDGVALLTSQMRFHYSRLCR